MMNENNSSQSSKPLSRKEISKRYYERHRNEVRAQQREYYRTHAEELKARSREYYQTHRAKILLRRRQRYILKQRRLKEREHLSE